MQGENRGRRWKGGGSLLNSISFILYYVSGTVVSVTVVFSAELLLGMGSVIDTDAHIFYIYIAHSTT